VIVRDCGHSMVWIGFAEDDEAKTVRPVAWAGIEEAYLQALRITWADTERGRGPTGRAIRTGQPCLCADTLTDPSFAPWREEARKRGYASSVTLPLLSEGRSFGAVNIYSNQVQGFSAEEVHLLRELVADLAHGIMTIRLRTAHQRAEDELRQSYDELARFNGAMVGRELRMIELKEEVNQLCVQAGQPPRYALKSEKEPLVP
jgi:GAF domain-containing protein